MIKWFREIAPIREKMLVLVVCATGLVAIASIASMVGHIFGGPLWGTISAMPVVVVTAVLGLSARRHICDPYVTTVVRMEALAAGDLTSPILFTDFSDCVGRLTRGMFTFRDAAEREIHQSQQRSAFVSTLGHHLSKLSEGDLTATIVADFPDEYAALKSNFNEALEKLSELIGAVSESTATIRIGSGEIAQASEDLARRTESNAASLEETAASVTQMDGRLKASSQAATRTVERADQAIVTVGDGRAVADDAVAAMGRVSDSAKGIDSVIEGLDKIAFQTRVLAMNAAVEAGRAGDAGRGFAVVADLVSGLAMRAEEEARRARDQLTVTQSDIATAVGAVQRVDGALADISGDVGQVHELLATMAADNRAQSAAITEISTMIGTMDQATQQNAAMVEQTSAAARNLASQIGGLTDQASRFNIGNRLLATRTGAPQPAKMHKPDRHDSASPASPSSGSGAVALVRADDHWKSF